jgi:hypothetical protein
MSKKDKTEIGITGLPIPNVKEEFDGWVEELWNEGYDLSDWTWEGLFEYYLDERKVEPDEKLPSGKTPNQKMSRAQDKHGARYITEPSPSRFADRRLHTTKSSSLDRGKKVKDIQDVIKSGQDPRNATIKSNLDGKERQMDLRKWGRPGVTPEDRESRTVRDPEGSAHTQGGLRAHKTKAGGYRTLTRKEELEMQEAWYSGKGTYRTTASGRSVRRDEDEATDTAVSDMLQKRREAAAQAAKNKASQSSLKAKGKVPTKSGKPMFESIVEYLFVEGYADTIESAEIIANNIGDAWENSILDEAKIDNPTKDDLEALKGMSLSHKERMSQNQKAIEDMRNMKNPNKLSGKAQLDAMNKK